MRSIKVEWDFEMNDAEWNILSCKAKVASEGIPEVLAVPRGWTEDEIAAWLSDKYGWTHYWWTEVGCGEGDGSETRLEDV